MAHNVIPDAEAMLDVSHPCLNHGFVRMVDYNGGDPRIVQAARVSYGAGTKSVREDAGLIGYLMKNHHTSPFEQVNITFHAKMPVFVARQWVRHRTAKLNEISGRYSVMKDEFYVPDAAQICYQNTDNKQGRSGPVPFEQAQIITEEMMADQAQLYRHYSDLLDEDPTKSVARELARVNLPLSLYTEWYWQIDLHNLFHFLHLRLDSHAQYEIRVYAEAMAKCAKVVAPMAYAAFEEHILNAKTFGATECKLLAEIFHSGDMTDIVERAKAKGLSSRDALAFEVKFKSILRPNG